MDVDIKALAAQVSTTIKGYVDEVAGRNHAALIALVEQRIAGLPTPKNGEPGISPDPKAIALDVLQLLPPPLAGKDADEGAIAERVLQRVERMLPAAKDGKDGVPGPKGDAGDRGEKGQQGPPGAAGKDGLNGKDGAQGVAGDQGIQGVPGEKGADGTNGKDGAAGLNGKDGRDGVDGKDGAAGLNGKDGAPGGRGERGMDGKSVTIDDVKPLLEGEVSRWELEFERRAIDLVQRTIDRVPRPKDGRDGFSLDDFDFEMRDDRTLVAKFQRGDIVVQREFTLAVPLDIGTYKAGAAYKKGDGVTYGGSWFIAQRDTSERPETEGGAWRCAAKRGRDGKDAAA